MNGRKQNRSRRNGRYATLRAWRKAAGLTQHQAAAVFGLTQGFWSHLEAGTRFCSPRLAAGIAKRTGVRLGALIGVAGADLAETRSDAKTAAA